MILVDSSVWIDYFIGRKTPAAEKLDSLLGETTIAAGDFMLLEVLQGFRTDSDFATARELLMSLTVVNLLNASIALRAAENFRALTKKGITVRKTIDTIIATYCIEHGLALLYSDKDFQPFQQHLKLQSAL